jgi:hypothetical protein
LAVGAGGVDAFADAAQDDVAFADAAQDDVAFAEGTDELLQVVQGRLPTVAGADSRS